MNHRHHHHFLLIKKIKLKQIDCLTTQQNVFFQLKNFFHSITIFPLYLGQQKWREYRIFIQNDINV